VATPLQHGGIIMVKDGVMEELTLLHFAGDDSVPPTLLHAAWAPAPPDPKASSIFAAASADRLMVYSVGRLRIHALAATPFKQKYAILLSEGGGG
jgi:hypothetical protein